MTIILAILLLCLLITVHEFGHFFAARLTGIPVSEFAVGMGPKIIGWKRRKYPTRFSLRLFPLGGYCAFVDEDRSEESANSEGAINPDAFNNQKVWKRLVTVFMGPIMNFILAIIVAIGFYAFSPVYDVLPVQILSIDAQGPAATAGLQIGDQILSVDGVAVSQDDPQSIIMALNTAAAKNPNVELNVQRGNSAVLITVTPQYVEGDTNPYKIGVSLGATYDYNHPRRLSAGEVLNYTFKTCIDAATSVFDALRILTTTSDGINQVTGPIGIVAAISEQTSAYGLTAYINLLVLISINLGIMNLLPIPGLDGSRILFMLFEMIRGKAMAPKKEAIVHLTGYILLFGLMILLTYKDVVRLITGG